MGPDERSDLTFAVTTRELRPGILIVEVAGDVDLATAPELQGELDRAVRSASSAVLVDLTGVDFFDSTGVRVLLRTAAGAKAAGVEARIVCQSPSLTKLFRLTNLSDVVPVDATVDGAVSTLTGTPDRAGRA